MRDVDKAFIEEYNRTLMHAFTVLRKLLYRNLQKLYDSQLLQNYFDNYIPIACS